MVDKIFFGGKVIILWQLCLTSSCIVDSLLNSNKIYERYRKKLLFAICKLQEEGNQFAVWV
jgi:hypothetical protein